MSPPRTFLSPPPTPIPPVLFPLPVCFSLSIHSFHQVKHTIQARRCRSLTRGRRLLTPVDSFRPTYLEGVYDCTRPTSTPPPFLAAGLVLFYRTYFYFSLLIYFVGTTANRAAEIATLRTRLFDGNGFLFFVRCLSSSPPPRPFFPPHPSSSLVCSLPLVSTPLFGFIHSMTSKLHDL